MKKFITIIAVIFLTSSYAYANGQNGFGSVLDNNDGSENQILVNTGDDNGNADVGTWKNPSDIPELKGEKGDKGDQGEQGIQGKTGQTGTTGEKGETGATGKKGNKGDRGVQGKGLKDRVNLMVGFEHQGKKWTQGIHGGYDVNNNVSIIEVRFTRKFGKSWTDRQIEYLQKQLDEVKVMLNGKEVSRFEEDNMEVIKMPSGGLGIRKKTNF